ncbi:DUF7662 domain-containing protein [Saccharothrix texasensis]|uniref:DUF7662 domain-containing protein n=1 Tax=Saccharothrix texasensis TaxID=103734 RepID=A0A3N1H4G7_9PSEU|nr:hypothetical protein [Saccharothrix texasensis]ROP37433.1 hypothetical protein EDD40_2746 [Saccharothrix texasensis]
MSKYGPLTRQLAALAAAGREAVEFDFTEVARLVGGLPPTAYDARPWWANSASSQGRSWRDADWHVARVDLERRRVRFERGPAPAGPRRPGSSRQVVALGVETDAADVEVRVRVTWERAGPVRLASSGALVFPTLPRLPGVYRVSLADASGQETSSVYVGETEDLDRRFHHGYRRPGADQQTNQRLHDEMRAHLAKGGAVTVAVATSATIDVKGASGPLSLTRKTARVLAEHAALASIYLDGNAVVINRDKDTG